MIIDQLPLLGGDVQGTDEFPIERGTTTYKTTQAALIKPATDAAAAAQAAADDANEKGLPPGGTAGQVLTKADSSDYSASWEDPSGGGDVTDVTADMLGIVINGNSTPVGASVGQYVIVKNSTITGITDGLYAAAQAIPANTAIDSTYLTGPIAVGGLNAVMSNFAVETSNLTPNNNVVQTNYGLTVIKSGNFKIINLICTLKAINSNFVQLCTIPSGYLSTRKYETTVITQSSKTPITVQISPNDNSVRIRPTVNLTAAEIISGQIVYI